MRRLGGNAVELTRDEGDAVRAYEAGLDLGLDHAGAMRLAKDGVGRLIGASFWEWLDASRA